MLTQPDIHALAGLPGGRRSDSRGPSPESFLRRIRRNFRAHLLKSLVRLGVLIGVDVAALSGGREVIRAARAGWMGSGIGDFVRAFLPQSSISGAQLLFALILAMVVTGGYRAGDRWREPVRILGAAALAVTMALYGDLWHGQAVLVVVRGVVVWFALGVSLVALRTATFWLTRRLPRPGMTQKVLEIRGGEDAPTVPDLGPRYRVVASLSADSLPEEMEAMEDWLEGGIDTLLVSGDLPPAQFGQITDFALTHGCHLLTVPRTGELVGVDPTRIWVRGVPLFMLTAPSLRASQLVVKRALDIVGALLLIVFFLPLMIVLAVAVKLGSPGPVLFRHRRAGLGGKFFWLLKFRSMRADAEELLYEDPDLYRRYAENDFKLPEDEDPRVTRFGRFLRKTSLDELPQLLNVLKGDLSLVGPRPVVEPELEMYRGRIPTLLSVKPGMTGAWQISGRSEVAFPARAEMDLEYVRNWSLIEDLWILFMTVPAVFARRGAH